MPKLAEVMGAMEVSKTTAPGLHFVGTVPGLALQVTAGGARSWVLRVVIAGRRRDMGLGAYPSVTLAHAHAKVRISANVTGDFGSVTALEPMLCCAGQIV